MARQLFTLLIIVTLLVASTSADSCLGTPALSGYLSAGSACGGAIPCAKGLACDLTSTCSAVKVGDACLDDWGCPFQSTCNGPDGKKKCFAVAGPGEKCSDDNTQLNATCSAFCDATGKCRGSLGDTCKTTDDCNGYGCHSGVCLRDCGETGFCKANQYCDPDTEKCVTYPTSGDCGVYGCSNTAVCVDTDLTGTKQHCVKLRSVAAGSFCNTHQECASGQCWRHKCQGKSPASCVWPSSTGWTGCSLGEVCTCNNGYLTTGFGTCKTEGCWESFINLYDCLETNCQNKKFDSPKNCVYKSCQKEYDAYNSCDSANVLWSLYVLYY